MRDRILAFLIPLTVLLAASLLFMTWQRNQWRAVAYQGVEGLEACLSGWERSNEMLPPLLLPNTEVRVGDQLYARTPRQADE